MNELYEARTFEEFWDRYQEVNADRTTRIARMIGTTSALVLIALAIARRSRKLALSAPLVDYAIAQLSQRAAEPHWRPLWHVRAELRLWLSTLRSLREGRGGRRDPYV